MFIETTNLTDEEIMTRMDLANQKLQKASYGGSSFQIIQQIQDIITVYQSALQERAELASWEKERVELERTIETDPNMAEPVTVETTLKPRKRVTPL